MPRRDFELDRDQMIAAMDNVGARAGDLRATVSRNGYSIGYRDRALALVGECHALGCPPPEELVMLLHELFRPDGVRQSEALDDTNIAGDDPGNLQRQAQQRIIADGYDIRVNSVAKFQSAAKAEAVAYALDQDEFRASVYSVANASGADRKDIRRWRDEFPEYRKLVRDLVGGGD